jgi:anti-sigma regulatory factor (Ser/Thr protein kinase)
MNLMPHFHSAHEFSVELPAAHAVERHARELLHDFAQSHGMAEEDLQEMEFIASELFSNAVDHGGGQRAMQLSQAPEQVRIMLHMTVRGGEWTLRLEDQGGGDPLRVQALIDDESLPGDESERGRGLFLIKSMLERLEVLRSRDGRGLAFVATKSFKPEAR